MRSKYACSCVITFEEETFENIVSFMRRCRGEAQTCIGADLAGMLQLAVRSHALPPDRSKFAWSARFEL